MKVFAFIMLCLLARPELRPTSSSCLTTLGTLFFIGRAKQRENVTRLFINPFESLILSLSLSVSFNIWKPFHFFQLTTEGAKHLQHLLFTEQYWTPLFEIQVLKKLFLMKLKSKWPRLNAILICVLPYLKKEVFVSFSSIWKQKYTDRPLLESISQRLPL